MAASVNASGGGGGLSALRQRPPPTRSIRSTPSSTAADSKPRPSTTTTTKQPTLAKRLLFPHLPASAPLPPLLASPSAEPELNAELYDFIAIALRAYVNPWWTKLTRYDKQFLPHITHILTSVLRSLETRLLATDLSPLVFRDLPTLLNQHCVDYRNAHAKLLTSYASGGAASLPQLFHQMQNHMAISPDGDVNEEYVRQAVDHILKACLPDEDYEPETERYIVREIVVKVLVGGVFPKITQPWFIHKLVLDLLGPERKSGDEQTETSTDPEPHPDANGEDKTRPALPRRASNPHLSFQSLAIFVLSAVRSLSGICLALIHAYKQALDTIKKVNESKPLFLPRSEGLLRTDAEDEKGSRETSPSPMLKPVLPGTLVPPTPMTPAVIPPSSTHSRSTSRTSSTYSAPQVTPSPRAPPPAPNYTAPSLALLSTLLTPPPLPISSSPSPPTPTATSLALRHTLTLLVTLLSPFLSRLLPYLLYTHVFNPTTISSVVKNARRALFPEGWPAPSPVDPTPEEQLEMRRELERRLAALVPSPLTHLLGPTPASTAHTLTTTLDPLSSQACNTHLLVLILDLVLVTVFPEMGVPVVGGGSSGDGESASQSASPVLGGDAGGLRRRHRTGELTPPRPESRPP